MRSENPFPNFGTFCGKPVMGIGVGTLFLAKFSSSRRLALAARQSC
jgi:hypothetical protein